VNSLKTRVDNSKANLIGQRFGRLTVISEGKTRGYYKYYLCKCDCGNEKEIYEANLRRGLTKSCGCLQKERARKANLIHGHAAKGKKTKLYRVWCGMHNRCKCKTNSSYELYGARGITVCDEWKEFLPFYDWAIANRYREGLEIDRIDGNKGYGPDNCRWVTPRENGLNKRNNRLITINGETRTLSEWAEISGINYDLLWYRVHAGWTGTDMLKPPRTSRQKTRFYEDEDNFTKTYTE
jgi:hypothetical protein